MIAAGVTRNRWGRASGLRVEQHIMQPAMTARTVHPAILPSKSTLSKRSPRLTSPRDNELDRRETEGRTDSGLLPVKTAQEDLRPSIERRRQFSVELIHHIQHQMQDRALILTRHPKRGIDLSWSDSPIDVVSEFGRAETKGLHGVPKKDEEIDLGYQAFSMLF